MTKKTKDAMSADQRKIAFAHEFLANGRKGPKAAIDVGFAPKSAHVTASRLLKNAKVLAIINEATKKASEITGVTVERTLQELARLAYSDPRRFYNADGNLKPIHELDDDCAACIASLEVDEIKADGNVIGYTKKMKQWDKNSALEKTMKYLKMLQPEVPPPGLVMNNLIMGDNMLEAARRIAFVLSRGSGRIITQNKA